MVFLFTIFFAESPCLRSHFLIFMHTINDEHKDIDAHTTTLVKTGKKGPCTNIGENKAVGARPTKSWAGLG